MTPSNPAAATTLPALSVAPVRFEHQPAPLGLGVAQPRLSWVMVAATPNWQQAAYELEASTPDQRERHPTGRVESGESVLVRWPFAPLRSRERRLVRVRVWGADGSASTWSEPAWVEAGLL